MRPEEEKLFKSLLISQPDFLNVASWTPGPDPPDVLLRDKSGDVFGVELTEWLDSEYAKPAITRTENQMQWLVALDCENHTPPLNFQTVALNFKTTSRFSPKLVPTFVAEFYNLVYDIDKNWPSEMGEDPQKFLIHFPKHPALERELSMMSFQDRSPFKAERWVLGTGRGGAYDPKRATAELLQRFDDKRDKPAYPSLKSRHRLSELVLVLHYGIKGLLHNAPFEGVNWKIADVVAAARSHVSHNPGPFDRVLLYLAYNQGHLFTIYP